MKSLKEIGSWLPVFFMAGFIAMNILILIAELASAIVKLVL